MICRKCRREIPADAKFCQHCGANQHPQRSRRTRGNGAGTAYRLPSGKWRAEVVLGYSEGERKIRRTKSTFDTKKAALAYLPELLDKKEAAKTIDQLYRAWSVSHYKNLSDSKVTAHRIAYGKLASICHRTIDSCVWRTSKK